MSSKCHFHMDSLPTMNMNRDSVTTLKSNPIIPRAEKVVLCTNKLSGSLHEEELSHAVSHVVWPHWPPQQTRIIFSRGRFLQYAYSSSHSNLQTSKPPEPFSSDDTKRRAVYGPDPLPHWRKSMMPRGFDCLYQQCICSQNWNFFKSVNGKTQKSESIIIPNNTKEIYNKNTLKNF